MPRLARLDAPGVVHHVVIQGIERRNIFVDDDDRDDFLERVSHIFPKTQSLYWPGHASVTDSEAALSKSFSKETGKTGFPRPSEKSNAASLGGAREIYLDSGLRRSDDSERCPGDRGTFVSRLLGAGRKNPRIS